MVMELNLEIKQDNLNFQDENKSILATLLYEENDKDIIIKSIHVDEILRGQGIASKLMEEISGIADIKNKEMIPICSYAKKWILNRM